MQQTPPPQQIYGQQPYPNQPYPYPYPQIKPAAYDGTPLPPPPKPSNKWILAIIIPFCAVLLLLIAAALAIFVPSFMRYKEKAKQSSISSAAKGINSAAHDTLSALKADEEWVMGNYIISSDSSKNVYVGFDEEKFYKKEKFHFAELDKYDYFIVFENGEPVYTAASESWNDKKAYVGTFPSKYVSSSKRYEPVKYSPNGERILADDKATLEDLYEDAFETFNGELSESNYNKE